MIPIYQANGQIIKCPECGDDAPVRAASKHAGLIPDTSPQQSPSGWWMVDCKRSGKKLYPSQQLVTLVKPEEAHGGRK